MGLGTIRQILYLMHLPDGEKSLLYYCQVSSALAAGGDLSTGLFFRPCGVKLMVNNRCNSRLASHCEDIYQTA